ncbi:hypothetical protein K492DRAFT_233612 [Lichtheimia hyalospora FSU 10163]|nr:hypothetical protein K492DRAFT_233612 [Lichtheimia hyalospora FSU 10163]
MLIVDTQPPTTTLSERNLYDREGMLDMSDRNGCHGALGGNTTPVLSPPSSPECLKDYEDDDDSLILYYQQRDDDDDDDMTAECSFNRGKDQDEVPSYHQKPFDLAAFAKELYDNRLSVLQNNNDHNTGFLLTEQDELEYEKLRKLSKMPQQQHYAEEDKIELSSTHQFIVQQENEEEQQQTIYNEDQHHQYVDLQLNEEQEEQPQQSDLRQHDRKESTASMNTSNCSCASRLSRFKELLDVDLGVVDILEQEESQQQQRVQATKSLGLFGSLRQVTSRTRSQSASGGIRGLVRSLSTTVHRSSTSPSLSQLSQKMTPAAVAAIHHHTGQDDSDDDDFKESGKGMRMFSQLVGRVRRSSRRGTKRINMDTPSSPTTHKKDNERSKIVRRTIIYVRPDTENFMKTIEQPALDHHSSSTYNYHHHQPSLLSSSPTSIETSQDKQHDTSLQDNPLKGIELREMSDGSVSWGIVKKEGNRKSFYDPFNRESKYAVEETDDDEEDINEHLLDLSNQQHDNPNTNLVSNTPPPPIPKRSPQRRQQQQQQAAQHISTVTNKKDSSTTDIYYAPDVLWLLDMISDQEKLKHSPSVEEQLDEVIRAFSCSDE